MSDTLLRCALIYRLESGSEEITLLAKYDHASDIESGNKNDGNDLALYGDRDKNYGEAVGMVISNDGPGVVSEEGVLGGFKVVKSDMHQVVYGADSDGLCLAIVTGLSYPTRTAITMLTDLYTPYSDQFSLQSKSATSNSLTKKSKPLLSEYCAKFSDSTTADKASALNTKVEAVQATMQDNIASMLKNTEQAESLAERSNQLNEQASVFQKKSKDLRKQMRCKNIKMTVILVVLIVGVLVIILAPLIARARNAAKGGRLLLRGSV